MHKPQDQVRDFCALVVRAPTSPAAPMLRDARLRARLILEEALETASGLVGRRDAMQIVKEYRRKKYKKWSKGPDVVETIDGLCDLLYVAYGTAEAVGVDLEPYFDAVHAANMKKTGESIDEHGKRGLKPPGWRDPKEDIRLLLASGDNWRWEDRYRR